MRDHRRARALALMQAKPLIEVQMGVKQHPGTQQDMVYLRVGDTTVYLTAERAEEYAVNLRTCALELRNGGQLS